ncbi:MAG: metalloregulator ArsR/SmtB family transcription factor [Phycisphaerales bacterium]|nr:metalloregulator ArsR/SmtB family transcription factor [Phycisphaerales bacterium]
MAIESSTSSSEETEGVFRAMADTTRQRLLHLLTLEELNVSELVEIMAQPQSTISRHLKILREAGLVRDRRDGTAALYSASAPVPMGAEDRSLSEDNLSALMLTWLKRQPLPSVTRERLQRVLQHRDASSGASFFNRLGKRWDELRTAAFGQAFASEAFLSLLPHHWTVADIGTGTGYLLPILAENFETVLAVEPAETMLACARQRIEDDGASNVKFRQGDLFNLPIDTESCDLAIAILVIHHVADPAKALEEMLRIVRPGGRVLIVEQEAHENQAFYERMRDLWWGFAPTELSRQLVSAGFKNVRHQPLMKKVESPEAVESPNLFVLTGERPDR